MATDPKYVLVQQFSGDEDYDEALTEQEILDMLKAKLEPECLPIL